MCVDVSWASKNPGANVLIYGANGGNNQKFWVEAEDTDKWSIRGLNSGMYLDVEGGTAAAGANVCQWPGNDQNNQRWKFTATGDHVTINSLSCDVYTIGSWANGGGTAFNMDVDHALTSNSTNILVWTAGSAANQKFVLLPTTATDPTLPVPSDLKVSMTPYSSARLDTVPVNNLTPQRGRGYPSWMLTPTWLDSADNAFELCDRYRYIRNDGTVEDWTSLSSWSRAENVQQGDGLSYWDLYGIAGMITIPEMRQLYKAVDYEYHVRSANSRSTMGWVHGDETSAVLRLVQEPFVQLTSANFGPDGLHVGMTSNYLGSYTNIHITDVAAGGEHYTTETLSYEGLSQSDEFVIPMDVIGSWIASGTELTISYRYGTEMMYDMGIEYARTLTSGYIDDRDAPINPPRRVLDDGRLLKTDSPWEGSEISSVWIVVDGESYEVPVVDGVAMVPYPFGKPFDMFICYKGDGDSWNYIAQYGITWNDGKQPCHAWTWGNGEHFLLEHQVKNTIVTSRTIDAQSDTYSLDTREWQTLSFGATNKGTFKATGVLVPDVSEGTVEQLLALEKAHHVLYRAPSGEMARVGITQVSYDASSTYTKVTVTMTQETV